MISFFKYSDKSVRFSIAFVNRFKQNLGHEKEPNHTIFNVVCG